MTMIEIRGALARGYCHPENENKELDSDLINAMVEEIAALEQGAQKPTTNNATAPVIPIAIGCPCIGCTAEKSKCEQCVADHQRT